MIVECKCLGEMLDDHLYPRILTCLQNAKKCLRGEHVEDIKVDKRMTDVLLNDYASPYDNPGYDPNGEDILVEIRERKKN